MDAEKAWGKILLNIKERVGHQTYKTWFEPTKGAKLSGNTLVVDVPNLFFIDWLEEHFHELIYGASSTILGREFKVRFNAIEKGIKGHRAAAPPVKLYTVDSSRLQKRYTFDSFVVGSGNRFAHAAALAVAKSPGDKYNPLFIYGAVGLGKTHLIQAIGNYVKKTRPRIKVYYTSCEKFLNEMIDAIQNGRTIQFKNRYRSKDILLIDDIQFLENKEGLQEEIFHTFNSLHDAGRQVVITSDRPPRGINGLEERLVSRFQWGLVCDLKPPDIETRIAILQKKAELSGVSVPSDVLLFIAENIRSNIRELEGALVTLLALSSLSGTPIMMNSAKEMLKDIIGVREKREISLNRIQEAVANHYGITSQHLRGKRRIKNISVARQIAIYIARKYTKLTLKDIGKGFGGRDHSTILHDYEKTRKEIESNKELKNEILKILETIQQKK